MPSCPRNHSNLPEVVRLFHKIHDDDHHQESCRITSTATCFGGARRPYQLASAFTDQLSNGFLRRKFNGKSSKLVAFPKVRGIPWSQVFQRFQSSGNPSESAIVDSICNLPKCMSEGITQVIAPRQE